MRPERKASISVSLTGLSSSTLVALSPSAEAGRGSRWPGHCRPTTRATTMIATATPTG